MDQPRAQATARDAAENAGKAASEAVQRVGAQIQPMLDQGKSVVQDLANQASEVGRQAVGQAGDLLQNVRAGQRGREQSLPAGIAVRRVRTPIRSGTTHRGVIDRSRNRVRARLSDSPALNIGEPLWELRSVVSRAGNIAPADPAW